MRALAARALSAAFFVLVAVASVIAAPRVASAAPTDDGALDVLSRYVFSKAVDRQSVNEVVVRVENLSSANATQGRVLVEMSMPESLGAETSYRLEPHGVAYLHLPVRVTEGFTARIQVERDGVIVARQEVRMSSAPAVHVVDLSTSSRLYGLRGARVRGGTEVDVDTPLSDAQSGELVLPSYSVGWAGVDLAVISSDQLARLSGQELDALSAYVLGGGTLVVNVSREEDLRTGNLPKFVGGPATRALPRPEQLRAPTTRDITHPRFSFGPPRAPMEGTVFSSWAGGNLQPSPLGALAQYGLGRVVVLGFDLGAPDVVDDPWVQYRFLELLTTNLPSSLAEPGAAYGSDLSWQARQLLDSLQKGNWGVALSAILLCVYAVVAGPVSFARAKKKNRPLRALLWLPLFSMGVFVMVVVIGIASHGSGSKARRLTFIDVGAGMDRGVGFRLRSVLFSESATFDAAPERQTNVLRPISSRRQDPDGVIQVDRDGLLVHGANVAPSETAILREAGVFPLGAGISVSTTPTGDVVVHNRTGKTLKSVMVNRPDGMVRFFLDVAPDATVTAAGIGPEERPPTWLHMPPDSMEIQQAFAASASPNDGMMFAAIAGLVRPSSEWVLRGVPVVLATFEDTSPKSDLGAPVQWDGTLVRVVGIGGEP